MKIAFFDTHGFDQEAFEAANKKFGHEITFFEPRLTAHTASMASGFPCVCAFVNDKIDAEALNILSSGGTKLVALRSAGFNQIDMAAAAKASIKVVRVPEYSPFAIAEHVVAMILTLNRKTHRAYNRVREGNFSLNGLVGFDLHSKTVGIVGCGKIGKVLARIMTGFGCRVLVHDLVADETLRHTLNCEFTSIEEIFKESDIISLHVPLTKETRHFINDDSFSKMKEGVMLINTGRGALIETKSLIRALKSGKVGHAGLDVYEEEEQFFFQDLSGKLLADDDLMRLMSFPNVLITGHQGFLTHEALANISDTTLQSITDFEAGKVLINEVR